MLAVELDRLALMFLVVCRFFRIFSSEFAGHSIGILVSKVNSVIKYCIILIVLLVLLVVPPRLFSSCVRSSLSFICVKY